MILNNMEYLYHCVYISCGSEIDGGIWELKETDKTFSFIQREKSFFNPNYTKIKVSKNDVVIRQGYKLFIGKGDVLKQWNESKEFTTYPKQCGIPYIFTPITEEQLRRYKIKHFKEKN